MAVPKAGAVPVHAAQIFGSALPQAVAYAELLATEGVRRGLMGPSEAPKIWDRHVLNSTVVSQVTPVGVHLGDIGSGAGLPGVPIALVRPDLQVTLVEPLLRRSTFLSEVVSTLGLGGRVRVVRARAEDLDESFDVVTGRAVATLSRLLVWVAPLRRDGGSIVLLKGVSAADEIVAARKVLRSTGLSAEVCEVVPFPGADPTRLVICR